MPAKILLEICAASYPSALAAQEGGADRIELCTALPVGGLTPSAGTIRLALRKLDIPVFVLLRPREGDFIYSDAEFELMKADIRYCRKKGVAGIVTGILTRDAMPDIKRLRKLIRAAGNMPVVCHRAFDYVRDPALALEQLTELGFCRILTAGQHTKAWDGRENIAAYVRQSAGRIAIMPGSGIHADNATAIIQHTGVREIHMTAGSYQQSNIDIRHTGVRLNADGAIPEFDYFETSVQTVRKIKQVINHIDG